MLPELDVEIRETALALEHLEDVVRTEKQQILAKHDGSVARLVSAHDELEARKRETRFLFIALVRAALHDYLLTGSGAEERLQSQLGRIAQSIANRFGTGTLSDPQPMRDSCAIDRPAVLPTSGQVSCVLLQGDDTGYAIFLRGSRLGGLPLYVVEAGSARIPVSFGSLFSRGDLEIRSLKEANLK